MSQHTEDTPPVESQSSFGSTEPDALTYGDYLNVPDLLKLQHPLSDPPHHDEMLFIIIHQAYELWFKLNLHELDTAMALMREQRILKAHHFVTRVVEVMKLLVRQIHILETMTPADFLQFRDNLHPASGFQSVQFREIEFAAGLKDERYLRMFKNRPEEYQQLRTRFEKPDLRSVYYDMLRDMGFDIPDDVSYDTLNNDTAAREQLIDTLSEIYHDPYGNMKLYLLTESITDLDMQLGLWRDHHVRVVSRIIGDKPGTGGSSGVSYLKSTTDKRAFPYLWQVRTVLEKPA